MKIITKTYLLVGILIAISAVNIFTIYGFEQEKTAESYSIIRAADIKQKTETVSALAISIANGNDNDREALKIEIQEIEQELEILKNGGVIREQNIIPIPNEISGEYGLLVGSWNAFKNNAMTVQESSVFDQEVVNALNYVLDRNEELIILVQDVENDFSSLGRDYREHKEAVNEMVTHSEEFGRQVLLLSIGEGNGTLEKLKNARISFEYDFRKITNQDTSHLPPIEGHTHETLIEVPRENSQSLRELEPLWEAMSLRLETLEEKSLLSPEFQLAKNNLDQSKIVVFDEVDGMLDSWNAELNKTDDAEQSIIQALIIINLIVFGAVIFVVRQSSITSYLTRIITS